MKHLLSIMLLFACMLGAEAQTKKALSLADPYILYEDGVYYAYGTTSEEGIEVFTSKNLKEWENSGWALRREDTTSPKWFWAPEVYNINGRYLMYFSGNEQMRAAWSDSPMGPFKEIPSGMLYPEERNIDHHLFIDDDGKPYIFFARFMDGTITLHSCELASDLTTVNKESLRFVLRPEQEWERKDGVVNEGPFILKHKGTYYITHSGNGYTCQDYAIGAATSESIKGPWRKVDYNPILHNVKHLVGVGHHSFFRDKKGRLRIVFHAHKSTTEVHPRTTHIGFVKFKKNPDGGPDILTIDKKKITHCQLKDDKN